MFAKQLTPGTIPVQNTLAILADDLTGAADSAARCLGAGLPATIFLQPPQPPLPSGAVAFTSDSRHLPPGQAADQVRTAVHGLRTLPGLIWYKKIDSTLRGNLGSELDALLVSLNAPAALICPAFPAQDRSLIQGQLVAPTTAQHGTDLRQLLSGQSRLSLAHIALHEVRSADLTQKIATLVNQGVQLLVMDGENDADLAAIRHGGQSALPAPLFCGSAGLVGVLAQAWVAERRASPQPGLPLSSHTLMVVGSGSAMAHRQIRFLCQQIPNLRPLILHATDQSEQFPSPPETETLLLHQPEPEPGAILDGPIARQRAGQLAALAVQLIDRLQIRRLVLVGGDTAMQTLTQMGISQLQVLAELLPGIPLCSGQDRAGHRYQIILKPGSFGDEETLLTLTGRCGL